ncbi:glycosyltransferase [Thermodesulfobacteriota bacterium]
MPELSIIITTYNAQMTIRDCLQSLEKQKDIAEFEVIVIDSSKDKTADIIRRDFPWARLFFFKERLYCGSARNIGISKAKAEIIAFLDADCIAGPDWAAAILRSHEGPHLAIGGAIGNADPDSMISTAAYFGEFSQWMPVGRSGPRDDIAGANMSYKKSIFEDAGEFIEGTYCSDTVFHWQLKKAGIKLHFDPDIVIYHHYSRDLFSLLRHEIEHGRSFAKVRMGYHTFGRRRWLYCLGFFPLFMKIAVAVAVRSLSNPVYIKPFLKSCPVVLIVIGAWVIGEVTGYLEGLN